MQVVTGWRSGWLGEPFWGWLGAEGVGANTRAAPTKKTGITRRLRLPLQDLKLTHKLEPRELETSRTQRELEKMHGGQRELTPSLALHLEFLQGLPGFAGLSDHSLLYTTQDAEPEPKGAMLDPRARAVRPRGARPTVQANRKPSTGSQGKLLISSPGFFPGDGWGWRRSPWVGVAAQRVGDVASAQSKGPEGMPCCKHRV